MRIDIWKRDSGGIVEVAKEWKRRIVPLPFGCVVSRDECPKKPSREFAEGRNTGMFVSLQEFLDRFEDIL
jgi:hypothetical protein